MADIGCAGILVADIFCGPIEKLPVPGELLAVEEIPSKAGGCAANVAIDLAKQGFDVDVCGCLGDDASAAVLMKSLASAGVDCTQVQRVDSHPTSKTVILLIEGEDRRYIHTFGANAAFNVRQISRQWIDGLKVFYLGGLCAMPGIVTSELSELLRYCRQQDIVTVVDVVVPKSYSGMDDLRSLMPHIDYFLPNEDEAWRLSGITNTQRQLEMFLELGVNTAIVTRGKDGVLAANADGCWQAEVCPMDSIDPSGSGDAFAAGIITGIMYDWEMPEMLRYATVLGASATTAIGTTDGVFTAEDVRKFLDKNHK
ncbi:MAG: carbohydrate kinase family protein [Pirellulales bacterium]|nr:carbohydrate kinase family protein [Pirellulales bacterium]